MDVSKSSFRTFTLDNVKATPVTSPSLDSPSTLMNKCPSVPLNPRDTTVGSTALQSVGHTLWVLKRNINPTRCITTRTGVQAIHAVLRLVGLAFGFTTNILWPLLCDAVFPTVKRVTGCVLRTLLLRGIAKLSHVDLVRVAGRKSGSYNDSHIRLFITPRSPMPGCAHNARPAIDLVLRTVERED